MFSGKMTILSYKTIFGLTFSAISENLLVVFFAKSQNPDFGHFLARLAKIGQNENFYKNRAVLFFYPLLSSNFMPSFRKIVGAVSEINSLHTKIRTNVISLNRSLSLIQQVSGMNIEPAPFGYR